MGLWNEYLFDRKWNVARRQQSLSVHGHKFLLSKWTNWWSLLYWACGFSDSVHQIWHNFQPRGMTPTCAPRCKWVKLSHWNYKHPLVKVQCTEGSQDLVLSGGMKWLHTEAMEQPRTFMTISDGHPQDLTTVTTAGLAPIHNSTPDLLLSLSQYYDLQLRALHASIVVVTCNIAPQIWSVNCSTKIPTHQH